jgi:hypothetical protein
MWLKTEEKNINDRFFLFFSQLRANGNEMQKFCGKSFQLRGALCKAELSANGWDCFKKLLMHCVNTQ